MQQIGRNPKRYGNQTKFAYFEETAHFITDNAPEAVAELSLDWLQRAG